MCFNPLPIGDGLPTGPLHVGDDDLALGFNPLPIGDGLPTID